MNLVRTLTCTALWLHLASFAALAGERTASPELQQLLAMPERYVYQPWEFEGRVGRALFQQRAGRLVQEKKFAELEKLGEELRARPWLRFPDGAAQLDDFTWGVAAKGFPQTEEGYRERLAILDEWRAQFPASIVERQARAMVLMNEGYFTRKMQQPDPAAVEKRSENNRLFVARQLLEANKEAMSVSPWWYLSMLWTATGLKEEGEKERYVAIFQEGTDRFPDAHELYLHRRFVLDAKQAAEWGSFAEEAAKKHGPGLYARIVFWGEKPGENLNDYLESSGVKWPLLKEGFEELRRECPDSTWILNGYCIYATALGDQEKARQLFQELGERCNTAIWGDREMFDEARAWANETVLTEAPKTETN